MDFVQKSNFFWSAYFTEIISKRSFLILRKEKNDFKRKKLKFLKGPKNGQFRNGLVGGFCPKIEISLIAVFFIEIMAIFERG